MGEPEEIGGLLLNGLSQAVAVYNVVAMDIPASPSQEFAAFCFAAAVWRELYPGTPPPGPTFAASRGHCSR